MRHDLTCEGLLNVNGPGIVREPSVCTVNTIPTTIPRQNCLELTSSVYTALALLWNTESPFKLLFCPMALKICTKIKCKNYEFFKQFRDDS